MSVLTYRRPERKPGQAWDCRECSAIRDTETSAGLGDGVQGLATSSSRVPHVPDKRDRHLTLRMCASQESLASCQGGDEGICTEARHDLTSAKLCPFCIKDRERVGRWRASALFRVAVIGWVRDRCRFHLQGPGSVRAAAHDRHRKLPLMSDVSVSGFVGPLIERITPAFARRRR